MSYDWFTSDWHLGHAKILAYCPNRPWRSVEEMDRDLIARFNSRVQPGHRTLFLGDFLFGSVARGKAVLEALNGQQDCVRGNHDGRRSRLRRMGFGLVVDRLTIPGGVVASHYPPQVPGRKGSYLDRGPVLEPGQVCLHGHTHSTRVTDPTIPGAVHVGVDAWDWYPAPASRAKALARGQVTG